MTWTTTAAIGLEASSATEPDKSFLLYFPNQGGTLTPTEAQAFLDQIIAVEDLQSQNTALNNRIADLEGQLAAAPDSNEVAVLVQEARDLIALVQQMKGNPNAVDQAVLEAEAAISAVED